jgi:hypothetical protein
LKWNTSLDLEHAKYSTSSEDESLATNATTITSLQTGVFSTTGFCGLALFFQG